MTTSFLTITEYCLFIGEIGFFSNAIFGGILVFLTIFCIQKQFGSYKKLLVNFQIVGFIFAAFHFTFPTLLHTYNRSLAYLLLSHPFHLPKHFLEWMIGASTGIFSASLCLLAIQFLYRYWSVFDNQKLKYFNGFYYLIWVTFFLVFGAGWAFAVGYCFALDSNGLLYLSKEILEKYEKNVSDIPIVGLLSYETNGELRWESVYGVLIISFISLVQYSIITVCAFKMYKGMKEKLSKMSTSHQRIHKQFYKALLIQTIAPSVFLFQPVFFMLFIPYFDLQISFPSSIFASGFTVYPAIDSICIMYCVSEYGRCFKKLISKAKGKFTGEVHSSTIRESSGHLARTATYKMTSS